MIPESLLQFVWKFRLFGGSELRLAGGELLEIVSPGKHNHHAGPDFTEARLRINGTLWAGNVEVHVRASDWFRHQHEHDPAYSNLILHVVWKNDAEIKDRNEVPYPVLELANRIDKGLMERWRLLSEFYHPISCGAHQKPDEPWYSSWLQRMTVERIEEKTEGLEQILRHSANDWEEAFYVVLARSFGFGVNAEPFEQLARLIPLRIVKKHRHSQFQLEALFLGLSGLINENQKDAYPRALYEEFLFLKRLHSLRPMASHVWKHLRMRPVNFPEVRIVQFTLLLAQSPDLNVLLDEQQSWRDFEKRFRIEPIGYWENHYQADVRAPFMSKKLGTESKYSILINAVIPFLFIYARYRGLEQLQQRVLHWMEEIPAEKNRYTRMWTEFGVKSRHAGDSQGVIRLFEAYCEKGRCLDCVWGLRFLRDPALTKWPGDLPNPLEEGSDVDEQGA